MCRAKRALVKILLSESKPQDLLEGVLHHKLATATLLTAVDAPQNEWNCIALAQAAQSEPTGEVTKRTWRAQDLALLMKCIEFYEYMGHKNPLKYAY
jgi:hypothetical protein